MENKKKPSQWKTEAGKSNGYSEDEVAFFEEIWGIEKRAYLKGLIIGVILASVLSAILFLL